MASIVLDREPVGTTFPLYVQYEEFNDYLLANAFVPLTVLVLVFLAYVLKIGLAHMKNRPPYKLKYTILVYNAIQVIMSMAFVVMAARAMFAGGILPSKLPQFDPEVRKLMTDVETVTNTFPLVRSYDEFIDYPLSQSLLFLVIVVIVYLSFVLKIGPDYMKNRPPYSLKNTLLVYNAVQVILSVLFLVGTLIPIIHGGLFPKTSAQFEPEMRNMMFKGIYIYFLGKLTELLDTVFFVLRKKHNQISFLHVYHHSSVVVGTWAMVFYSLNMTTVYAASINSAVHVVMYFYYFMAALGPQFQKYLKWKKHITTFQRVQFISMFVHQVISLVYTKGEHTIIGVIYVIYSSILFYYLFSDFSNRIYGKPAKTVPNGDAKEQ